MAGTWDELVQKIKDRLDIVEVVSEQVVLKNKETDTGDSVLFTKIKNLPFALLRTWGCTNVSVAVQQVML